MTKHCFAIALVLLCGTAVGQQPQITWQTGLASNSSVIQGPTDQPLQLTTTGNQDIKVSPNGTGKLDVTYLTQGQIPAPNSTGQLNSESGAIYASQFMSGAASPCAAISAAIATANSISGTDIDARGIGGGVSFIDGVNAGCGILDSNFMKNTSTAMAILNAQVGTANGILGGAVRLPAATLNVSLVPGLLGTCISSSAANDCSSSIAGPVFPPGAVIIIPNKVRGLEGRGRGDNGGVNTTILVCTALNTPATGCVAPVKRHWVISSISASSAGGRTYMTVNVTGNTFPSAVITGHSDGAATVTMFDYTASAQISSGQTITVNGTIWNGSFTVCSGKTHPLPATCGSSTSNIAPTINSSGQVVFAIGSSLLGTETDSITVGSNIVAGEYVSIEGNSVASNVDDGTWRVCATSSPNNVAGLSGITGDNSCPANPSNISFAVVGTQATLDPLMTASTSVNCTVLPCGNVHASVPVIDLGNPQTVSGKFQFATGIRDLTINCNSNTSGNTVDCTGWRDVASDEETEVRRVLSSNFMLWGADVHSTINQNAQEFADMEFISGGNSTNSCFPGLAGLVAGDIGPRNFDGWTANFNGCANLSPTTAIYDDVSTTTRIANGHGENVVFGEICGQNNPCQGSQFSGNGGPSQGSCAYANGNGSTANICAQDDGPYQISTSTTGAIAMGTVINIAVISSTGCAVNMNSVITDGSNTEASTVTAVPDGTHVTVASVLNAHLAGVQFSCSANAASIAISNNFSSPINGGASAQTGSYLIMNVKENTAGVNTIVDDYVNGLGIVAGFGPISSSFINHYGADYNSPALGLLTTAKVTNAFGSGIDVTTITGFDQSANSALTSSTFRAADETGTGGSSSKGGGLLIRAGNNSATNSSTQAGSLELLPGASTGSTQGAQGLAFLGNVYVKGTTVTQWNLQCESANMTVADCGATPGAVVIGVAEKVNTNTVQVAIQGNIAVNASAAVTLGHTVCAGATAGKVTDSTGTAACATAGTTIGIVIGTSGAFTLPDGTTITASTTLPIIRLTHF